MAKAKRLTGMVLNRMALMLRYDYRRDFVPRFNYASQLRPKKRPKASADQIRNATDHFAKALDDAMECDSELKFRVDTRKKKRSRTQIKAAITLNLARAKKHFVAAQFYCLIYSHAVRDKIISDLLRSPRAKGKRDFDKYRQRHRVWKSNWKEIDEPKNDETEQVSETLREIRRLEAANVLIETNLEELDTLFDSVKRKLRKNKTVAFV
jgi:hypothetical protein